jgi:hypothetical protein
MDEHEPRQPMLPVVAELPNIGLVVDFGEQRRKKIRRLKRGRGALTRQIQAAVEEARRDLGIESDTEIVPVVLLYRCPAPKYTVSYATRTVRPSEGEAS